LRFDEEVKEFGFIKSVEESCVYKKVSGSTVIFLVLYVDDILLIRNDIPMMEVVKSSLRKSFSMKERMRSSLVCSINMMGGVRSDIHVYTPSRENPSHHLLSA
jgi:hypothetical protein